MELVIPSHCSHHHFYKLFPFTCLAPCFHTLNFRIVFGLLFLKPYPCRAVLGPVEKTRFLFTFFFASNQTCDRPQKAVDFCQDNSQTRATRKMLLLCSLQPWKRKYISLFSCRECDSLKFVFWYVNIDPSHFPNLAILWHWRHTIHKLCTTDFFFLFLFTQNVWRGQRQRRWESLANLD